MAPSSILSKEDLYQYGAIGLLKALERFRPEVGVPFKSFAYKRIHGEVIDAIRKGGVVSRGKYEKVKALEKTITKMKMQLDREPSVLEICETMNISDKEYYSLLSISQLSYMVSLDTKVSDGEGDFVYRIDTIEDTHQKTPEEQLTEKNLKSRMKTIISELPERQKLILALYYNEELTLFDIGQVLGLSESRVSQILNQTLLQIRAELG